MPPIQHRLGRRSCVVRGFLAGLMPLLTAGCLDVAGLIIQKNVQAIKQHPSPELNVFVADSRFTGKPVTFGGAPQNPTGSSRIDLNSDQRMGVRFNVLTNGHWGQEFFYSVGTSNLRYSQSPGGVTVPYRAHNFGVNAMGYFRDSELVATRPFFSLGIGGTVYTPAPGARSLLQDPARTELQGFGNATEFAFNYGGGVKQTVTSRIALRADLRHFIGRHPSFGVPRVSSDPNANVLPVRGAIHNLEASIGIVIHPKR